MNTHILLVDDHLILRQGLKALLEAEPDLAVVGEASNGRMAVEMARDLPIDLVITDVGMPDMNGIEATRRLLAMRPGVKVIALSMHADRRFVGEMLKVGASGYVLKEAAFEEVVQAIRTVLAGKTYLSPGAAGVVVDDYVRKHPSSGGDAFKVLTAREREILQLLAEGKATKEVAMVLKVSVKTVETHRRQIMNKLNLYSVAELTKYAIREGLTSVELGRAG